MNGGSCFSALFDQPGYCYNCDPGFTGPLCDCKYFSHFPQLIREICHTSCLLNFCFRTIFQ